MEFGQLQLNCKRLEKVNNSQVAELVALRGIGEVGFDSHTVLTGSNPVLTTKLKQTIMNTLLFSLSLLGTFCFVSKFFTWHAYKISPHNFKKEISNGDILIANVIGYLSIIGWTLLFYLLSR